jgi:signal transduction histidine kinase
MFLSTEIVESENHGERLAHCRLPSTPHNHTVQFYEDRSFLLGRVITFLFDAIAEGNPAVAVIDRDITTGLHEALREKLPNYVSALSEGRLVILDASEILSKFMVDGMPNEELFQASVGALLRNLQNKFGKPHVYGEMVSLLWRDGKDPCGTLALEQMWNRLSTRLNFSLLCGYRLGGFSDSPGRFEDVCREHSKSLPAEGFGNWGERPEQLQMIASLQLKAKRLEVEIEKRRHAEDRLKKHAAELAKSNLELEQFAHVASHDLKEPLRMVKTYVQLLERKLSDSLDEEARMYVGFAVEGASRMQALIDDLLDLAFVSKAGSLCGEVDLNDTLEEAKARLWLAISDSKASIVADNLPRIEAIAPQMLTLFQNLLGNALKFRKDRDPRIHISAVDEGDHWLFGVADNGIGIKPVYAEKIFVIFQRLHTRQEYPGTGIGLSICRKIVERHSGKIWVESTPDVGSTFYFTLPKLPPLPSSNNGKYSS